MSSYHYTSSTPDEVKSAPGLHLITQNTPNGQAVQIFLEELKDAYGTEWTTSVINISTNVQKSDWFLRLDPNGRIPVLVDNNQSPPFTVHETSAELFYLLKVADKEDRFGFKDELERSQALQWTFFWHGSGAPYQGQVNHFTRAAPEKIPYAITRFRNEYVFTRSSAPLPRVSGPSANLCDVGPCVSSACWRYTSRVSIRASRGSTSRGRERASTASRTSRRGRG